VTAHEGRRNDDEKEKEEEDSRLYSDVAITLTNTLIFNS
jgi:hypothetical protein